MVSSSGEHGSLEKLRNDFRELHEHFHALLLAVHQHDPALHAKVCKEKFEAAQRRAPPDPQQSSGTRSPVMELLKKPALLTSMCGWDTQARLKAASRACNQKVGHKILSFGGARGLFGAENHRTAECLDLHTGKWAPLPRMRFARTGCVGAMLHGAILICGGPAPLGNVVDRYSLKTGRWDFKLPAMRVNRQYAAAGVLKGRLYVCGGTDNDVVNKSIEFFNPALTGAEWQLEGEMMTARRNSAAAVLGSQHMLLCGGDSSSPKEILRAHKPLASVESFGGPAAWQGWLPPMKVARSCAGAAALKDTVFVCGGEHSFSGHQSVESFTFEGGWATVAPMLMGRFACTLVAVSGSLYVMGGVESCKPPGSPTSAVGAVERYDPELNQWEFVAKMQEGRVLFASASI